jgi:hypothetical protein
LGKNTIHPTIAAAIAKNKTPAAAMSFTLPIMGSFLGSTLSQSFSMAELNASADQTNAISNKNHQQRG